MEQGVGKAFGKYVAFNVMGALGLSCYILADTYFVAAGVGAEGLAALNLAIPVYSFINGLGLMTGMGGATAFAIAGGRADDGKKRTIFTQVACVDLVISLLFSAGGILFAAPLSAALGADSQVLEKTSVYLRILMIFAPMFMFNNRPGHCRLRRVCFGDLCGMRCVCLSGGWGVQPSGGSGSGGHSGAGAENLFCRISFRRGQRGDGCVFQLGFTAGPVLRRVHVARFRGDSAHGVYPGRSSGPGWRLAVHARVGTGGGGILFDFVCVGEKEPQAVTAVRRIKKEARKAP